MGQEDACGICGKHYQECSHYSKYHLSNEHGLPLCGGGSGTYVTLSCDLNTEDLCKRCKRSLIKAANDDFNHFLLLVQENS